MFRKTILICSFIFSSIEVFGQTEGVFWEISGDELKSSSYLFGTIHLICEQDYILGQKVKEKLLESETLILEVDMDDPNLALSMMSKMHNEGGEEITDFLSEQEYRETRELLKERTGMDIDKMKSLRPMMLMSFLYPSLLECETKSFENELMIIAKSQNKSVLGLESVDDQLSLFDKIPLDEQYQSFYEYAGNLDKGKKEFRRLIDTYKKEEIALLVEIVSESPEYREYQDILLDQRNKNWMEPMQSMMREGSMFFAVGAGHLGGETGLIHLLKEKGYTLKRLDNL
ncbi:MAG: TraB/GumN family protein [Cyclobacteriaceae bacterium]